jgi:hypothetical protein
MAACLPLIPQRILYYMVEKQKKLRYRGCSRFDTGQHHPVKAATSVDHWRGKSPKSNQSAESILPWCWEVVLLPTPSGLLIHVERPLFGSMDGSDNNRRLVPALANEKGLWGRAKRVVVDGIEVARVCPDCGEECSYKRTKFLEVHGQYADGRRKCQLLQQQPELPADAHAGGPAAVAAGGHQQDAGEQADGE